MWRRQSPPYQGAGIRSHWTRGDAEALLSWEDGLEPFDMWQRQSPPYQGGEIYSHWTRGNTGALLS
jgi:hypothetical protein